jgi:nickel/cobalt exporter
MRPVIVAAALASIALAALFWLSGGDQVVLAWALEGQRAAQGGMGRALMALRAGEPAAVVPLLSVSFLYGFFHAAGPGHGKLLIGGYGAARAVGALRLSAVALASSLAQAATAVLLVGAGLWVLNWSREYMTDLADRLLQPLGFTAIATIGLWLVYRGVRGLGPAPEQGVQHQAHHHHHGEGCGHAHAPAAEDVAAATSPRELLILIGAVAIRPCTGAIFLLILTAQMGVFGWGVAGAIAMALGTACVTIAVALAAVFLRKGVLAGLSEGAARMARAQPALEIAVGLTVAWIAGGLALATV